MGLEVYPIGVFGEMYQFDQVTTIIISSSNIWYTIDNMTAGELQEVEFQNSQELKILRPGRYLINYKLCVTDGANTLYKFRIAINGTTQGKSQTCARKSNALDIMNPSGPVILDLSENDIITLEVLNATNTSNPVIIDANVSIKLIE